MKAPIPFENDRTVSCIIGKPPEAPQRREYSVDKIFVHEQICEGRHSRNRWYGYTSKNDTLDPANLMHLHFLVAYWLLHSTRSRQH